VIAAFFFNIIFDKIEYFIVKN